MKLIAKLFGAALVVYTSLAAAQDAKQCQTTYKTTVEACAKSLAGYEPALRAGFQKACVKDAQLKRDLCLNGGGYNQCVVTCQQIYDNEAQVCEANYQRDYATCGGSFFCQAVVGQERDACVLTAVTKLNQCTQSCVIQ